MPRSRPIPPARAAAPIALLALALVPLALSATPARAMNDEEMQLCVNSCLYHFGPADNPAYETCVARQCAEEPASPPAPAAGPAPAEAQGRAGWQTLTIDAGRTHVARVQSGGLALSYMCRKGSEGLVAVEGMRGSARAMRLRIDGRPIAQPFAAQGGMRATPAPQGSAILAALGRGSRAELSDDRGQGSVPLSGSGRAIAQAMGACGLRP